MYRIRRPRKRAAAGRKSLLDGRVRLVLFPAPVPADELIPTMLVKEGFLNAN
jgi:hypothetical protein